MLLPAVFAIHFHPVQTVHVTETKLFKNQKGKIAPGSIAISPDLAHYSYSTMDHKMIIDGKSFGPFISNGSVLYTGDSKNYAFLANQKVGDPPTLYWNGVEKPTDFPISSLFRAGETGGICWGEHKVIIEHDLIDPKKENKREFTRLAHPNGFTAWFDKIEKVYFSEDGSTFALRTNEKIPLNEMPKDEPTAPTTRDYIILADGSKTLRKSTLQVFPAPSSQGYAMLSSEFSEVSDYSVEFRGKSTLFKGEFYGKPVFSPDGKQFAFRRSFTGHLPDGRNIPFFQYYVNGYSITDLQVQSGLTYAPDGKMWVMCGFIGKDPYLYFSNQGMVSYSEFPGLGQAPPEAYKVAKFAKGKLVLLFQPKRQKPILFVEEKGTFDLGVFTSLPDTVSISPDGRNLVIACGDNKETRAFLVNLESPGPAIELMKPGYDLQVLGKGTFVWKSDHEVQFMILKNSDLIRVSASL